MFSLKPHVATVESDSFAHVYPIISRASVMDVVPVLNIPMPKTLPEDTVPEEATSAAEKPTVKAKISSWAETRIFFLMFRYCYEVSEKEKLFFVSRREREKERKYYIEAL